MTLTLFTPLSLHGAEVNTSPLTHLIVMSSERTLPYLLPIPLHSTILQKLGRVLTFFGGSKEIVQKCVLIALFCCFSNEEMPRLNP